MHKEASAIPLNQSVAWLQALQETWNTWQMGESQNHMDSKIGIWHVGVQKQKNPPSGSKFHQMSLVMGKTCSTNGSTNGSTHFFTINSRCRRTASASIDFTWGSVDARWVSYVLIHGTRLTLKEIWIPCEFQCTVLL